MSSRDSRDSFITGAALSGLILVLGTEALSVLHAVTRPVVVLVWLAAIIAGVLFRRRRAPSVEKSKGIRDMIRSEWSDAELPWKAAAVGCAGILAITLFLALYCPPSAPDALAYHLPRVERWILDRSLAFYPTNELRQLWIGPGHEYFLLHLRLVTGSYRVSNLIQWAAFALCPVAVSVIARELGAGGRGQLLAAILAVTVPMAVSQASGSQVDLFASFWLCATVAQMLRIRRQGVDGSSARTAIALGSAAGLAFLAKGTNAMFLAPFVIWTLVSVGNGSAARIARLTVVSVAGALAVAAPHLIRTARMFESPLGPRDSAGLLNEIVTPRVLASNVMRNASLHFNSPLNAWNRLQYRAIRRAHATIGADPDDRRTTWSRRQFTVEKKRHGEHISGNPLHAIVLVIATFVAWRKRRVDALIYVGCVASGALLFALLLKWQPWHTRLHLNLFIAAAGVTGAMLEKKFSARATGLFACVLVIATAPALLRDLLKPVVSRHSIFTKSYEENMLADTPQAYPDLRVSLALVASRRCDRIGLLNSKGAYEYAFKTMLEGRLRRHVEIRHVMVSNSSLAARGPADTAFRPCAVVQLVRRNPEGFSPPPPGFVKKWASNHATVYLNGP